jgi:hypothetical protein
MRNPRKSTKRRVIKAPAALDTIPAIKRPKAKTVSEDVEKIRKTVAATALRERTQYAEWANQNYFFTVVFGTERQKVAFLDGWFRKIGYDEDSDRFIDGPALAKALGIEIPACDLVVFEPESMDRDGIEVVE